MVRNELGEDYDVEKHFTPSYKPWDQRICLVPDSDLFHSIKNKTSSVVTDTNAGITTVVADINLTEFADLDSVIDAVGSASTEYSQIARYSWGRIYDFDRPNPKSYSIKVGFGSDHNNTGLSSNPVVIRTKQIKENY